MGELTRDLRYSLRMLVKSPVFTAAAVLTLALGIGLNAATFSAVRGILLRPLGGTENPEELVQLYRKWPGMDYGSNSLPHYQDLRDRTDDVFSGVADWTFVQTALSAGGQPERLMGLMVSANFFQTYGAEMLHGRAFIPGEEDRGPGGHPVVVLGNAYWKSRFGADPSVIGRTLDINGHPFEVVGVVRPDFKGPATFADIPFYAPLMMQRELQPGGFNALESRGSNSSNVVARLRPGVTIDQAQQRLDAVLAELRQEYPDQYDTQLGTSIVPQNEAGFHPTLRDAQFGMSAVIMAVVALLLLIACVNVANLFLARAQDRRREMGIRMSLGAGRRHILRQLLTESLVFGVAGGLAGLGLAWVALHFLGQIRPPMDGPWNFDVQMDRTVLLFTFVVAIGAAILFGLAPALQSANPHLAAAVKGAEGQRAGRSRASRVLVAVQMALSLVLLISSGLFLRSLQSASAIDPGIRDPSHLVTASLDPALRGYGEAQTREFFDRLLAELAAQPDVEAVGLTDALPLGLGGSDRGVEIPGYEFAEGELRSLMYATVTEGYLEAAGVQLVEGRSFERRDDENAAPVIIVNEAFRDRFWPGESGLGKVVQTAGEERTVIGVAATGKYRSLGEEETEFMWLPFRERFSSGMTLLARTSADPMVTLGRVRQLVQQMDADMPLYDVRTMEDHMGIALMPARLGGSVLGIFGLLGLTLAAVGLYGVMAYSVSRRRREIGIRMALGARSRTVVGMVMGEGLRLVAVGALIGMLAAFGAGRLVQGLLYNTSGVDPVAFVGVPLVLLAVAALAVLLPARRAASVQPNQALRAE
ncbi:MAG: ABC transporter permease [Gemmatimonadota bacterium]